MLEDLDEKRLDEFLTNHEEFKERVELKKKKKNCLDVLEDIKEMIENQKEGTMHEKNKAKAKKNELQEGRKLYATKFGEKCFFDRFCKGFNGNQSFEWKSCMTCKPKTERILDLSNSGSSSSTEVQRTV